MNTLGTVHLLKARILLKVSDFFKIKNLNQHFASTFHINRAHGCSSTQAFSFYVYYTGMHAELESNPVVLYVGNKSDEGEMSKRERKKEKN